MKLKKKIILTGIVLWVIAFIQMLNEYLTPRNSSQHIVSAFSNHTYTTTQSSITASGTYANGYLTDSEREDLLLSIAHDIGIENNFVYDTLTEDGVTTASLSRTSGDVSAIFKCISSAVEHSEYEQVIKNLITVTISFHDSLESGFYYKNLLQESMKNNGVSADISITLRGKIPGALSMNEKNVIADTFLKETNSNIQTENRSDNFFTIYAYTENIEEYCMFGNMKTNLNLVITYNEKEDFTEILVATPFFNEDF